ncbi:hypothetical protein Tco_0474651 [Tanacetum coccineum]
MSERVLVERAWVYLKLQPYRPTSCYTFGALGKKNGQTRQQVVFGLVQVSNGSVDDATWENVVDVVQRFRE